MSNAADVMRARLVRPMRCCEQHDLIFQVRNCQIFYHEFTGEIEEYCSKYQHNRDIQPSLMFEEMGARKCDPQLPLRFGIERSHG